ncbi:MAG: T9SS type A sorting domain-containing protein [Candidatus Cloacimonetes bacterium]|nr:T9SS type A sorting domain-containing protein [Candidatus Cloacimonadota bacterium]
MKTRLVLILLATVFFSLQAEMVIAESDYFTVDSKLPEITIITPNGGEVYSPDDIAEISFEIVEDSFAAAPVEPVTLQVYFDEVQNPAYDVTMPAAETLYSYDWTVPNQPSENVFTKVIATDYYGNSAESESGVFEISEPIALVYGDVDDNGEVEAYDVSLILMYVVDLDPIPEDPVPWENWRFLRADVDLDNEIHAVDGSYILQYVVEIRDSLPVYDPYRSAQNNISIYNDDQHIYLSSNALIYGINISISNKSNLELDQMEMLAPDCLHQQNGDNFSLASAYGVNGNILRIPYQRRLPGESALSLIVNSNGCSQNISYTVSETAPRVNKLSAIYPNPFNPNTTIDYELAESGQVNIEVYNIKGQKVAVLIDEHKDAGRYSLTWNADNCNSGIFFISFATDNFTQVKKAILLK